MPRCANCGGELTEGTKYCPSCGATVGSEAPESRMPVPPTPPAEPPPATAPPAMTGQAPKKKGLATGAKVAIILGIAVVVLIVLALVFFVIFFANVITGPADVSNEYVRALDEGEMSTAWSLLASETQQEEGRAGFEEKVKALEGKIDKWYTTDVNVESGGRAKVVMDITLSGGDKVTWDMYLVKEEGEWKIRQVDPR